MGTLLAVSLVVAAAMGLVGLIVLELMREVMILRHEVAQLGGLLSRPVHLIDRVIRLPDLSLATDQLIIGFVEDGCPPCADLEKAISSLQEGSVESLTDILLVNRKRDEKRDEAPETPGRSAVLRMEAEELFDALSIAATPTLAFLKRQDDGWKVEDATVGLDVEWLRSKLYSGANSHEHGLAIMGSGPGRVPREEG